MPPRPAAAGPPPSCRLALALGGRRLDQLSALPPGAIERPQRQQHPRKRDQEDARLLHREQDEQPAEVRDREGDAGLRRLVERERPQIWVAVVVALRAEHALAPRAA